jgi:DNA-binding CsgD family transcriptional regulator
LWQVVAKTLRLTGQLKLVVELVLRGQSDEQMMEVMGIGYSTLRTYFDRIAVRTGARGRTALLRLILTVSHGVKP